MKNIVFKLLIFTFLFFIFNITEIDSEINKKIIYNLNNIYEENYYTLYLKDINSNKLIDIVDDMNLKITSYTINDKKYYVKDIFSLVDEYTKDMPLENKLYYSINGIKIDKINLRCKVKDIIKLEKDNIIY